MEQVTNRDATGRASRSGAPWLWHAPGWLFYLVVGLSAMLAVWGSSLQSFGWYVATLLVWWAIAAVWVIRLVGAALRRRLQFTRTEWLRWLVAPLLVAAIDVWTQSDGPFELRLALSRSAMDQAALEVMAGGTTDRGWIGLWPAEDVERLPTGMRFIVPDCGFIDRCGFAWAADGMQSSLVDSEFSEDRYEDLGRGWFFWIQPF